MKFNKINHLKMAGAALLVTASLVGGASVAGAATSTPEAKSAPRIATLGAAVSVAPGIDGLATATCPAGKVVTGGGGTTSNTDIYITDSFQSGNGWTFRGINKGTFNQTLTAEAICISATLS